MTDLSRKSKSSGRRLDEAVRRATPATRVMLHGHRGLLRALGLYANVFAVLVALGIPNGTLRQAAVGAMASFDGVVRQASAEVVYAASADSAQRVDSSVSDPVEPPVTPTLESGSADIEIDLAEMSAIPVSGPEVVERAAEPASVADVPQAEVHRRIDVVESDT